MNRAIKKLLSKEVLDGNETGRLMILDLLSAYKDLSEGGSGAGLLTDAEKIEIVNKLTDPGDINRFNDFRGVHDYLTTVPVVFDSYAKAYEIYYWKVYHLLSDMRYSEEESSHSKRRPVIMTEKQYEQFTRSGKPNPAYGIAVLRDIPGSNNKLLDENGFYNESEPAWRQRYTAETILSTRADFIKESLDGMKDTLSECLARQTALELVGRFIKVSHVKILLSPIDENKIDYLNNFMASAVNSVHRYDETGGIYESEIKEKLSSLFTPIDLTALSPLPQAITKARRMLNFDVIKNGSEAFASMIKREWRNDCGK